MNYRLVGKYMGYIMLVEGIFMIPAVLVALYFGEPATVRALLISICAALLPGALLSRLKSRESISMGEGFVICALGWIVLSLIGALPFYISGMIPRFIDCWFETVSGFTTTGSSILTNVEALSNGLLYWRSFSHWIGGMGVLVFLLAIVPLSKGNGEPFNL
ncbi:MAG: potassium transporter TrkG, partial [Lachnospiraceae bacterium]